MRRRLLLALTAVLAVTPVAWPAPAAASTPYDQVLDNVQFAAFQYFWNQVNPANGLIHDRSSGTYCSIASVGFGLTSICVGIDHGWITRAQGQARVQTTLTTFWTLPQGPAISGTIGYKGFFYHFLNGSTGLRDNTGTELSDIDTALLLAGILDCKQYFNTADPGDVQIRTLADEIYQRVDWTFFQHPTAQGLMISWLPNGGTGTFNTGVWKGYNEMMIMYILAMGSPTHPVPAADWTTYVSGYQWLTLYGQTYAAYASLFTYQYSHCWLDFRNKRDGFMTLKGSDYFQNSRKASLAQQAYCIAHPGVPPQGGMTRFEPSGYSATLWGLTAGDGPAPVGYTAHGAPDGAPGFFDDGTIQPTAAVGSLCFAPEICLPAIQNFYDNYPALWGTYGFRDGFNLSTSPDWYDTDWLGIDLGPELIMIENYRNASIWQRFMANADVQHGMTAAGFVATVDVPAPPPVVANGIAFSLSPNPFSSRATLRYTLPRDGAVRLTVHDLAGRQVARVVDEWQTSGEHTARFDAGTLPNGVYWYRLSTPDATIERRGVLMK